MKLSRLIFLLCLSITIIPHAVALHHDLSLGFWLRAGAARALWHCANQGVVAKSDRFSPGRLLLHGISSLKKLDFATHCVPTSKHELREARVIIDRAEELINRNPIIIETDGPCPIAAAKLAYVVRYGHYPLAERLFESNASVTTQIDALLEEQLPFGGIGLTRFSQLIRVNRSSIH